MAGVNFPIISMYGQPYEVLQMQPPKKLSRSLTGPVIPLVDGQTWHEPYQSSARVSLQAMPGNHHPGYGRVVPGLKVGPIPRPLMMKDLVNPYHSWDEVYSGVVPYLDHE